jgi:hypothetical protein
VPPSSALKLTGAADLSEIPFLTYQKAQRYYPYKVIF